MCAGRRTADCGRGVLNLVEHYTFDIVILDIGMPDMSGYEVARRIRAIHHDSIFLAALTAWTTANDRRQARLGLIFT